nr:hypothetical protein [Mucilaginibacter sp. L294]
MHITLKRSSVIALLFSVLFFSLANGQVFKLYSFSGEKQSIQILPINGKAILAIICSKDTVYIKNVNEIKIAKILNDKFLIVTYSFRAGSGINATKTVILSVSQNHIYQSLHVTSFLKEDFLDFRKPTNPMTVAVKTLYNTDLSLTGSTKENYKIRAKIHNERKSVAEPKSNFNTNLITNLKFDKDQNVFYSSHEYISRYFTIFEPKSGSKQKGYLKGTFPSVKFGKDKYYYINGEWYDRSDGNYLAKYTYR